MTKRPIVLSLCDHSGNMVKPWAEVGFECWLVDLEHPPGITRRPDGVFLVGADVRTFLPPRRDYAIVFAFPPCTDLAVSGARWFKDKGLASLSFALDIVAACQSICLWTEAPWMIENPVSTLSTYWRDPDHTFDPHEYAEGDDDPDAYSKKTCLWTGGGFIMPEKRNVALFDTKKIRDTKTTAERARQRSITSPSFARAVFEANAK